ncbi:MAG: NAD(P)H-binding protein [Desulfuromonadaceae bacterium]|nr:NAD(P)H-binding protein [Desulfuromonadaceae bacterium]
MKIFLTGGTGFVGRDVLKQLQEAGHQVRALLRKKNGLSAWEQIETVVGDTTDKNSLTGLLNGCDAVIHLVGIIREFPGRGITFERLHTESTRNMVAAAEEQGVDRYLQMSANGSRTAAVSAYHQTKWAAEQAVRHSNLNWTIFRPSLIFGPDDIFVNVLAQLIRTLPLVPVMGNGQYRLQPVNVTDVAKGFVNALKREETVGHVYHCGGPKNYSYDEILDLIGQALGKSLVRKLHHPLSLMKPLVSALQLLPQFPMSRDQLQVLLEGNCCDPTEWQQALGLELTDFSQGIKNYLS